MSTIQNKTGLLNIHLCEKISEMFPAFSANFAMCSDIINTDSGKFAYQITNLHTCREVTIDRYSFVYNQNMLTKDLSLLQQATLATKRTNVLLFFIVKTKNEVEKIKAGISNALRVINKIEGHVRLPKTKMYECNYILMKGDTGKLQDRDYYKLCYVFSGGKDYMFSRHLMSLYLLLIRLVAQNTVFENVNDIKSFYSACEAVAKNKDTDYENVWFLSGTNKGKYKYVYWIPFLKYWKEIYKGRTKIENFQYECLRHGSPNMEGIDRLIISSAADIEMSERFNKIMYMHGVKMK